MFENLFNTSGQQVKPTVAAPTRGNQMFSNLFNPPVQPQIQPQPQSQPTQAPVQTQQNDTWANIGDFLGGAANAVANEIKGLFVTPGGRIQPITTPQFGQGNSPLLKTDTSQTDIGSLKVGDKIPGFADSSAADKGNLIDNFFSDPKSWLSSESGQPPIPSQLTQAPVKQRTIWDNNPIALMGEFLGNLIPQPKPDTDFARAIQQEAINKNLPGADKLSIDSLSQPGGNPFSQSTIESVSKQLGIRSELSNSEFTNLIMALSLPVSIAASPAIAGAEGLSVIPGAEVGTSGVSAVSQLKELGAFTAVKTGFDAAFHSLTGKDNLSDLAPDAPLPVKIALDALTFLGSGYVSHGLMGAGSKYGPDILDTFTKNVDTQYNLPDTYTIKSQDLLGLDNKITNQMLKDLKISGSDLVDLRKSALGGKDVTIDVPATKVVTITDKPYWAKVKDIFGVSESEPQVTTSTNVKATPTISGALNGGSIELTPPQAQGLVVNSNLEGTPLGKEILKTSIQGSQTGQNIKVDLQRNGTGNLKTPDGIAVTNIELVDPSSSQGQIDTNKPVETPKTTTTTPVDTVAIREHVNKILKLQGDELKDIQIVGSTARGKVKPNDLDIIISTKKGYSQEVSSTELYDRQQLDRLFEKELQQFFPTKKIQVNMGTVDVKRGPSMPLEDLNRSTSESTPKTPSKKVKPERVVDKHATYVQAQAITKKLTDQPFENLSSHEKIIMKDQRDMAEKLYKDDPELALKVAMGEANAPQGLLPEVVHNLVIKNTTDLSTLFKLANSPFNDTLSTKAQGLRASQEFREPDSASHRTATAIKEVNKAISDANKDKMLSKTNKLKKLAKTETNKINLAKEDLAWEKFLNSIKC